MSGPRKNRAYGTEYMARKAKLGSTVSLMSDKTRHDKHTHIQKLLLSESYLKYALGILHR